MGGGDVGRVQLRDLRERLHGGVIPHHEIEHAGQKLRVAGGRPQGFRPDTAFGQELTQPLRFAGNKAQRLNCNDFSYFAGVMNRLLQVGYLPFRNFWLLVSVAIMPESRKTVQASANGDDESYHKGLTG